MRLFMILVVCCRLPLLALGNLIIEIVVQVPTNVTTSQSGILVVLVKKAPPLHMQVCLGNGVLNSSCHMGLGPNCDCIPGYYFFNQTICQPCAPGFFKDGYNKTLQCKPCAVGSSTEGLEGQTGCWPCSENATTYGLAGQSQCQTCPLSLMRGILEGCVCTTGLVMDIFRVRCVFCPPGYTSSPPTSKFEQTCVQCPPYHTTNPLTGLCTICSPGSVPNPVLCEPCPPGSMMSGEASSCLLCPPGSFSSMQGATECAECPLNQAGSAAGLSSCVECPPHSTLLLNRTACECHDGYYYYYYQHNQTRCEPCGPGTYGKGCMACPQGTIASDYAQTTCSECAQGSISDYTGTRCVQCWSGSFQSGPACVPCPKGTYSNTSGSIVCLACDQGFYSAVDGLANCLECPSFSQTSLSRSSCVCDAGHVFNYAGDQCVQCLPGSFQSGPACVPCPKGAYSNVSGTALACSRCDPGLYSDTDGSTGCLQCEGHHMVPSIQQTGCVCESLFFFDNNISCKPCASECKTNGTYSSMACSPTRDLQCAPCSSTCGSGYYTISECTLLMDRQCGQCSAGCISGYFLNSTCTPTSDLTCGKCMKDCPLPSQVMTRPCLVSSDAKCELCPPGSYRLTKTTCAPCPMGSISAVEGAVQCSMCPSSAPFTNVLRTQCLNQCPPGQFASSATLCSLCPPHTFGIGCQSCMGADQTTSGAEVCTNMVCPS